MNYGLGLLVGALVVIVIHHGKEIHQLKKEVKDIMTTEQEISDALDTVSTDVDTALEHIASLQQEVTDLQNSTPPEVDLSGILTKIETIKGHLEGVQTTVNNASQTPSA